MSVVEASVSVPIPVPLSEALSDYEKLRQANIERNEEFLKSLGVAARRSDRSNSTTNTTANREKRAATKKRKSDNTSPEEILPVESRRRSRRIQQLSTELDVVDDGVYFTEEIPRRASTIPIQPLDLTIDAETDGRVAVTAAQIRGFVEKYEKHDELISNELIVHTAYRMSYMSNQALGTRLKAIAKAAKSSSYEKLLVFYYALVAANLPHLASSAREILEKIGAMSASH